MMTEFNNENDFSLNIAKERASTHKNNMLTINPRKLAILLTIFILLELIEAQVATTIKVKNNIKQK